MQARAEAQERHLREPGSHATRCSAVSKCPDYVINKGHYFGTSLHGRRAGPERRRQARAHRLPEDDLVVNRRDLIKRGLALGAWLAARQTAAAGASSNAFARLKAAVSGQAAPQPTSTPTTSSSARAPAAARWRPGWRRPASACCCSRPAAIPGTLIRAAIRRRPACNSLPDDYDVPAFHSLATENEAMRWDFFVRHYADDARQQRDPKYRDTFDGADGGRRAVSARRHARRLHRAQRDDPRLSAQLRLESDRRPDRRRVVARREHARRTSNASRTAATGRYERVLSQLGQQSQPARLGRLAARPRRRFRVRRSRIDDLRTTIVESAQGRAERRFGGPTRRPRARLESQRRSQRLARRRPTSAIGLRYTPLTTGQPSARRHARAAARRRRAGTRIG